MRALAEYAMRGRTQAVAVAAISAAIPLLFWVSAAIIALTTLRRGVGEGLNVLLWASLPAIVWITMQGDPVPLMVLLGTAIMAAILKVTVSWVYTLVVGILIGIIVSAVMPMLLTDFLAEVVRIIAPQITADMAVQIAAETGRNLDEWVYAQLVSALGVMQLMIMLGSLLLARWWQAALYNPGGFREEFHRLIIPKAVALPLIVIMAFGGVLNPRISEWIPLMSVPFIIAGIAMGHGVVGLKKLTGHWLVFFYLLVFLFGPYLAFLDSIVDFRQRIQAKQN